MKTLSAFERQLDNLCALTEHSLSSRAKILSARDAIAAGRSGWHTSNGREDSDVAKCVDRFFRILRAADTVLTPEQVAQLEQHVHRELTAATRT